MDKTKINDLLLDYSAGMSQKDLKKKYQTSADTIYKLVDNNGIKRKQHKDLDKFYNLSDPEVQY